MVLVAPFRLRLLSGYLDHRDLHSFPTRRSSDLHTVLDGIITTIMATIQRINIIGSREGKSVIGRAVQQECRDRKSGSAGMPRPISYAVFCLKKKRPMNSSSIDASAGGLSARSAT